jgi:putative membrane protein
MNRPQIVVACAAAIALTGAASAPPKLNDAEIANVAYTADSIDIAAAKQALEKSKNPQIRSFAEEMVRDHTAVNDQALALLKKLNVKPQDNAMSRSLQTHANAEREKLSKLSGPAFDKAYIENEVAYHKAVDSALSDTLIPDSQNAELKSLLGKGLKLFQSHEQHAEQIANALH